MVRPGARSRDHVGTELWDPTRPSWVGGHARGADMGSNIATPPLTPLENWGAQMALSGPPACSRFGHCSWHLGSPGLGLGGLMCSPSQGVPKHGLPQPRSLPWPRSVTCCYEKSPCPGCTQGVETNPQCPQKTPDVSHRCCISTSAAFTQFYAHPI